jgi:hypothetical protein
MHIRKRLPSLLQGKEPQYLYQERKHQHQLQERNLHRHQRNPFRPNKLLLYVTKYYPVVIMTVNESIGCSSSAQYVTESVGE